MLKRPLTHLTALLALLGTSFAQAPTDIPGLQLWLDASDASTITTSGGLVTQWDDKSGQGNHATQADVNRQPTVDATAINGSIPAIHFDTTGAGDAGSDGLGINTALNVGRPYSVYIVDQYWGGVQGRTLQGRGQNWLVGKWNTGNSHFSGAFNGPNGAAGIGNPVLGEAFGGGVSEYFINGALNGRSNALGSPGNLQLGVIGAPPGNPPFDEPSQADVGEVVIFDRVLTDVERDVVQGYFHNKYGFGQRPSASFNATRTVPFTGADPGEGLDFQGTFHAAVNARGPGGAVIGNATFTDDTGVITSENEILNWGPSPTMFAGSADDAALNSVMESIRWTASNGAGIEDVTATVGGLTVGNTYKLQMLFGETTTTRHFSVSINGDQVIQEFQEAANTGTSESRGVAVVHEFIAQTDTLNVVLDGTAGAGVIASGDINPLIQGLTVEDQGVTATVTTGAFTSAADLDFSGNFVHAVNMRGPGGAVVGDATFTDDSAFDLGAENQILNWGVPNYGATADDDALESVMESIRWTATNGRGEDVSMNLPGLIAGQDYKLQLLWDEFSNAGRGFDVMVDGVLIVDNFQTTSTFNVDGGLFVTHEFTASGTELELVLDGFGTTFADKNPVFNALTLELIPEPSTASLLGLALFGLLARRRR